MINLKETSLNHIVKLILGSGMIDLSPQVKIIVDLLNCVSGFTTLELLICRNIRHTQTQQTLFD